MTKILHPNSARLLILALFTTLSIFLYTYKIDAQYVFTDELVYLTAGRQIIEGNNFDKSKEVPILGKYIGGVASIISNQEDISKARMIYAIMGVVSSLVAFLIVRDQYGYWYGLAGGFLYLSAPLVYSSTRMVMLESQLFLFWLLFHYVFLKYLRKESFLLLILCGVFTGLSILSKLPSLILYPFFFSMILINKSFFTKEKILINRFFGQLVTMGFVSLIVYFFAHIHLLYHEGIDGMKAVFQRYYSEYIQWGVSADKKQYIAGKAYRNAPKWTYWYYFKTNYSLPHLALAVGSLLTFVKTKKHFWTIYWGLFFFLSLALMQAMKVKNGVRYVAEFELPLVFIMLSAMIFLTNYINKKYKIKAYVVVLAIILPILFVRIHHTINLQPNGYHALELYLHKKTDGYTTGEKIYVYADSKRSAGWHFGKYEGFNLMGDPSIFGTFEPEFVFVAIEKEAKAKESWHRVFKYLKRNSENYEIVGEIDTFIVYQRKENFIPFSL